MLLKLGILLEQWPSVSTDCNRSCKCMSHEFLSEPYEFLNLSHEFLSMLHELFCKVQQKQYILRSAERRNTLSSASTCLAVAGIRIVNISSLCVSDEGMLTKVHFNQNTPVEHYNKQHFETKSTRRAITYLLIIFSMCLSSVDGCDSHNT